LFSKKAIYLESETCIEALMIELCYPQILCSLVHWTPRSRFNKIDFRKKRAKPNSA